MYRIISLVMVFVLLLLSACADTELPVKITRNQQNEQLKQAELDTLMAIRRASEWRVRDSVTENRAVRLRDLLEIAQKMQQDGETTEANRLAIKISKIVAAALQQADDNINALPRYPDSDNLLR